MANAGHDETLNHGMMPMALPATHIRFAVAVADRLSVVDQRAYLSGTLYPDSRWVTGVDRPKTHSAHCLDPDFPTDDFSLGWHIHCLCDRIQGEIYDGLLVELSELTPEAGWIHISAAKVVQDMNDAAHGDIGAYLAMLTHAHTPNGESGDQVAAYLGYVRRTYSRRTVPDWADYDRLWTDVGLERLRIDRIEQQVQRILADAARVDELNRAFDRMVANWSGWWAASAPKEQYS